MLRSFSTQIKSVIFASFALAFASTPLSAQKYASIIIDDLGNNIGYGHDIVTLPGELTIAILPATRFARDIARLATNNHKEVMLHLPMQSVEHHEYSPGMLDLHMTRSEFIKQLRFDLSAVPYIQGVNNHMGSLLTRHPGHMSWLMDELSRHTGLYFIDSKTTNQSIVGKIADEYQVPHLSRDFFLDPDDNKATIRKQFDLFIKMINHRGYAVAIAHPYPATIQFLKTHLGELEKQGIKLVSVSKLISMLSEHPVHQHHNKESHHVACTGTPCSRL
ncbi:MAG: divergent polysaccharide deacetylase family protein [Gammaproteobacteria bacterium]|nr:divergent polysaccharide deacetylase family protein [Gammaproteobacteria bacterium]